MTNARGIVDRLRRDCSKDHQHMRLEGGSRTRQSEVYLERLCKEIVRGLKDQMKEDGRIAGEGLGTVCTLEEHKPGEEELEDEVRKYWDDMSGKELDPRIVKNAREEDIEEFRNRQVYIKVPISECWNATRSSTHRYQMGRRQ